MKRLWEWLKRPRPWWFAIVAVLLICALVGVALFLFQIGTGTPYDVFAYLLYALSAILLSYFIYCIVYFAPRLKKALLEKAQKHEFTRRLIGQYGFRTVIFTIVSFAISGGFAIYNGTIGIIWLSVWYIVLGAYYLLLTLMRGGILLYHRKKAKQEEETPLRKKREARLYEVCGFFLIFLPIVLSAVILEMYVSDRAFVHSGYMIYAFAAYTFYKIIMAIYNFAKARKNDDMTVRAIRNINVADALVSALALQTAMFHEFSPENNLTFGNAIMGAIVCALTVIIGVVMIIKGNTAVKKIESEAQNV